MTETIIERGETEGAGGGQARQAQSLWYATEAQVKDPGRRLVEVTIIRPGESRNGFQYPEEVLRESLPRWEGVAAFADHSREKSIRNLAGVYTSPRWEEGVKANLRFIDDGLFHLVEQVLREREEGLPVPDIGISADMVVEGVEEEDGTFQVGRILDVVSADIVFQPAAGGSFDRVLESVARNYGQPGVDHEPPQKEQGLPGPGPGSAEGSGTAESSSAERAAAEEPLVPFKRVRDLQSQGDRLRAQLARREEEVRRLQDSLQEATAKYRRALLAANPAIPEELLAGSTMEELEESLSQARAAVERIRQHLEEERSRFLAVPAGAPARRGPDLSALSPREKILYGLAKR